MRSQNGMSDLSHRPLGGVWFGHLGPQSSHVGRSRGRDLIGPNGITCADPGQNGAQSTAILVEQQFIRPEIEPDAAPGKAEVMSAWAISGHLGQEVLCPLYPPEADMHCLLSNAR